MLDLFLLKDSQPMGYKQSPKTVIVRNGHYQSSVVFS